MNEPDCPENYLLPPSVGGYFPSREHIVQNIVETILRNDLCRGDELPGEHDLAQSFGISRTRVQDGLNLLETLGVVEPRPHGGYVVSTGDTTAVHNLVRLRMALAGFKLTDLIEVRVQLETRAVQDAAHQASPTNLQHLRALVDAMRRPGMDRDEFQQLDSEFHLGIADASANTLTATLMHVLRDAFAYTRTAVLTDTVDWAATMQQLIGDHERILTALEAGASAQAADDLSHHIRDFYTAPA